MCEHCYIEAPTPCAVLAALAGTKDAETRIALSNLSAMSPGALGTYTQVEDGRIILYVSSPHYAWWEYSPHAQTLRPFEPDRWN